MPTHQILLATATTAATSVILMAAYKWWKEAFNDSAMNTLLLLNDDDIMNVLPIDEAINVQRLAFISQYKKEAVVPERIVMSLPQYDGATLFKPAFVHGGRQGGEAALGLKVVSTRPKNKMKSLPTVPATILIVDPITGLPTSLMNGTYLTALRTAAGSGLATQLLARKDAQVLSIFGAGMQAKAHLDACISVRETISVLYIINRTMSRASDLRTYALGKYGHQLNHVYVLNTATKECVEKADIICTTTNSSTPVFNGSWLTNHTHINAIGSYTPSMQEIDVLTVSRCCVYIDTPHALTCGDLSMAKVTKERNGLMEIGEASTLPVHDLCKTVKAKKKKKHRLSQVLNDIKIEGKLHGAPLSPREQKMNQFALDRPSSSISLIAKKGRMEEKNSSGSGLGSGLGSESESESESDLIGCTLFKSVGTSVQDVATGAEVVRRARLMGIGRKVAL
jgi:ornithine cyclodeaminase